MAEQGLGPRRPQGLPEPHSCPAWGQQEAGAGLPGAWGRGLASNYLKNKSTARGRSSWCVCLPPPPTRQGGGGGALSAVTPEPFASPVVLAPYASRVQKYGFRYLTNVHTALNLSMFAMSPSQPPCEESMPLSQLCSQRSGRCLRSLQCPPTEPIPWVAGRPAPQTPGGPLRAGGSWKRHLASHPCACSSSSGLTFLPPGPVGIVQAGPRPAGEMN